MPEPASNPTPRASSSSVILVEEYGALAVALGSALKKFAPHANIHVAASFAQALPLVDETGPALFVIDFDPPQTQPIAFFERVRATCPDARVLVLAAGTSREIAAIIGSSGAIQFVEKPFDLAEFGAAVQALLGPWKSAGAVARGTLRDLALCDIAPLLCLAGATAEVVMGNASAGGVHIRRGQIVDAYCGKLRGTDALEELVTWRDVEFSENEIETRGAKTIDGPWSEVLSAALTRAQNRMPQRHVPAPEPAAPKPKTGKKVVIVDDTEMLLIFVEDSLTQDAADLHITTAQTGTEGVSEVQRVVPDLVLLDYSLPDINGDVVATRLLADPRTSRVPIVMMSGHVPQMTAAAAKLPNIVATIAKPFLSAALMEIVHRAFENGRLPEGLAPVVKAPVVASPVQTAAAEPAKPPEQVAPVAAPSAPPAPAVHAVPAVEPPVVPDPAPPFVEPAALAPAIPSFTPSEPSVSVSPPAPHPEPPPSTIAKAPAAVIPPKPEPAIAVVKLPPVAVAPVDARRSLPTIPPRNDTGALETRVLLALPLQISGMQFTPSFQIASVRARPATTGVALQLVGSTSPMSLPVKKRFHIGAVTLDGSGHLDTVRLESNAPGSTSSAATGLRENLASLSQDAGYFAPGIEQPMTMQLLIPLDLASIQLSSFFEIAQLVLKCHGSAVRGTLDGHHSAGVGESGATFRVSTTRLDPAQRISELVLVPVTPR